MPASAPDNNPVEATATDEARTTGAGLGAVMLAATAFSWGFIIVKALPLAPATLSFHRLLIGASTLALTARLLRVPWPEEWAPLLGAGIAFGLHQLLFIAATQLTSVVIVTLMAAGQPLLVTLVSRRAVGERVPRATLGCALLAAVGVALVIYVNQHATSRSWQGDLLALGNALVFTGYLLFAKRARLGGAPTLTFTAGIFAVALLVVAPAMVFGDDFALPDTRQGGLLLLLALGPGNGHLLLNWAHRRTSVALSALVLVTIPLLSSLWAHWVLGETLGWRHLVGILLVAIAVELGRRAESSRGRRAGRVSR